MSAVIPKLLRGRLVGNALSLYAVQGLNALVPIVVLPFLLRALSPSGYGSIVFAQALMGYAALFVEFGFNLTAARDISVARDRPDEVARIYWTTLAAKGLLLLVSFLAIAAVVAATPDFRHDWPVFAASALILVGNVSFPQWYFQGMERLKEVALMQALARVVGAIATIVLVRGPEDLVIAAVIMSAPQVLAFLAAKALRKPMAPATFYRPTRKDIGAALTHSSHMFLASVSTALYLNTNTFVLGLMKGHEAVAIYSLATRLIAGVQSIVAPLSQAVFPRASVLFARQRDEAWKLLRRIAWIVGPAVAAVSLLIAGFAPEVVHVLGGDAYSEAVRLIRTMAVIPILVAFAVFLAQTVMVNLGLTRQLFRIYLTVGVLNLIWLPILITQVGALGASIALVLAEATGPVLMLLTLRRHLPAADSR